MSSASKQKLKTLHTCILTFFIFVLTGVGRSFGTFEMPAREGQAHKRHSYIVLLFEYSQELAEALTRLKRKQEKAKAEWKEQQAKPQPGKLLKSVMGDRGEEKQCKGIE